MCIIIYCTQLLRLITNTTPQWIWSLNVSAVINCKMLKHLKNHFTVEACFQSTSVWVSLAAQDFTALHAAANMTEATQCKAKTYLSEGQKQWVQRQVDVNPYLQHYYFPWQYEWRCRRCVHWWRLRVSVGNQFGPESRSEAYREMEFTCNISFYIVVSRYLLNHVYLL